MDCENSWEKYSCRKAVNCPPNGECPVEDLVYGAKVEAIKNQKKCVLVLRKESFKTRYYNHKSSFPIQRYKTAQNLCLRSKEQITKDPLGNGISWKKRVHLISGIECVKLWQLCCSLKNITCLTKDWIACKEIPTRNPGRDISIWNMCFFFFLPIYFFLSPLYASDIILYVKMSWDGISKFNTWLVESKVAAMLLF